MCTLPQQYTSDPGLASNSATPHTSLAIMIVWENSTWLKQGRSGCSLPILCKSPRGRYPIASGVNIIGMIWILTIRRHKKFKRRQKSFNLDSVRLGATYGLGLFCMWDLLGVWGVGEGAYSMIHLTSFGVLPFGTKGALTDMRRKEWDEDTNDQGVQLKSRMQSGQGIHVWPISRERKC